MTHEMLYTYIYCLLKNIQYSIWEMIPNGTPDFLGFVYIYQFFTDFNSIQFNEIQKNVCKQREEEQEQQRGWQ